MDLKKLRNDIILIISLILVASISFIVVYHSTRKTNLVAKISVQNELYKTVELVHDHEEEFDVPGLHGMLHVHVKDGSIAIVKSNCPHQDCVKMGYVDSCNHPIVCAYNAVYITIDGTPINDVEIG